MNEKIRMQNLDAQGRLFMFQQQDARDMQKLDRAQALYDNQLAQQMQYRADATAAFAGAASSLTSFATGTDFSDGFTEGLFK
jgi:multidrug efflux pump subunit AcrA (membrane-fusion protein)